MTQPRVSIHFDDKTTTEIEAEARRFGVSVSQVAQWAWKVARKRLKGLPSPAQMRPVP